MYRSTTRPIDKLLSGEQRNAEEQEREKNHSKKRKKERIKEHFSSSAQC